MDHPLSDLITAKIKEAEANGAFDDLSGAGKPLDLSDKDADFLSRAMRQNGAVPEFVRLHKKIEEQRAKLSDLPVAERKAVLTEIAKLEPQLALAKQAWSR